MSCHINVSEKAKESQAENIVDLLRYNGTLRIVYMDVVPTYYYFAMVKYEHKLKK